MEDLTGQVTTTSSINVTEWNAFQQEFKNLISPFTAMSQGSSDQLLRVLSAISAQAQWVNATGGPTTYTLAMNTNIGAPHAYNRGQAYQFRPNQNNTATAVTANVGGLGPISVVRENGSALQAADLSTARDAVIRYNDTGPVFHLLDSSLAVGSAALPPNYIEGLTLGRSASETNQAVNFQRILFAAGQCRDSTNTVNLVSGSAIDKRWDANFAFGTGAGGYSNTAGTRVTGDWYRVFIIGRNINGTTDFGFDYAVNSAAQDLLADANTAQTAADGGSGWNYYRQIGWVKAAASTELEPFHHDASDPDTITWSAGQGYADMDNGVVYPTGTAAMETLTLAWAPPLSTAVFNVTGLARAGSDAADINLLFHPVGDPDIAPTRTASTMQAQYMPAGNSGINSSTANQTAHVGGAAIALNASRQLNVRVLALVNAYWWGTTTAFRYHR
tara:strand:- start:1173 stop:2507 length:1335 start_codon:yes stop_codon:yes gene_type:complete